MRIATLTKSWPAPGSPAEGSFIRARMAAVAKLAEVRVLHAVPWVRARPADAPEECPPVTRRRYWYVPGVLKGTDHRMLARSVRPVLAAWRREWAFDVLDSHFGYPEGAAAVSLGRELGVPVAVTLRGTEEEFEGEGARGRAMASALRAADLVIAVSGSLKDLALRAGVEPARARVIGNGADTALFAPGERVDARRRLGLPEDAEIVLSVGLLIERKGHHHLIRLLPGLLARRPAVRLVIVGGGPWEKRLRREAREGGVADRVVFAGLLDRPAVAEHVRAADVLALASRREGWANVFFEAFATGRPVVATDVGGAREAVSAVDLGSLVPWGDWEGFADALARTIERPPDPAVLRRHAEANTWDAVGARVHSAFRELLDSHGREGNDPRP